jgi:hypothetical protein
MRSRPQAVLSALVLVLAAVSAAGAEGQAPHGPVPTLQAVRTHDVIVVDGRLDEEIWSHAPPATEFTQRDPDEGKPATEATELRVAYDDHALYVGARLHDREPARIARQLSRRDRSVEADHFAVFLDAHHDHLTGAVFEVSAAGVQSDRVVFNDSWEDASWDAVWVSAVTVDEGGWSVEMRIPFSQLRFPRADRHTFGIHAERYIQRKNERAWLVHVPKTESGVASRAGHLEGIDGIRGGRSLEVLPYAVSRLEFLERSSADDPFNDGSRAFAGAGLDVKYGVSSNLTLDGTINPDFGQVEVDPAVVNLTAFETFFEEKRPFFIEGSSIFSNFGRGGANNFWGFNRSEPLIFYSRRIGRTPQGETTGDFVDAPSATTILGAAKLTGKTRAGWSVGLLDAVTGREYARTASGLLQGEAEIEPLTNYLVGRAHRELGRRGAVGFLATAVNRNLRAPSLTDRLADHAYVAGTDAHYFLDSKREWVVTGRIAASHVSGSTGALERLQRAAQRYYHRPDATHVAFDPSATRLRGWTGSVNLNRNSGIHGVNAALWGVSPGFESGDVGFNFNADRAGAHAVYSYSNPALTRFARRRSLSIAKYYTWNYEREVQGDGVYMFGNLQLRNYWTLFVGGFRNAGIRDDRATRGGPLMVRPAFGGGFFNLESDGRKRVALSAESEVSGGVDGGSALNVGLNVRYRPAASVEVSAGPKIRRNRLPTQYVGTFEDPIATATYGARYVFGALDQRELSVVTRASVVFSPRMSLQVYMQPLVSVGAYTHFKQLAQPRTYDFFTYGVDGGTLSHDAVARRYEVVPGDGGSPLVFDDPDFNIKSLRLNAIFRWEWRPGSALYFVWTEQRADDAGAGVFGFRQDLGRVFAAPADDVILFKIAWWFNRP